ncbi:MAG TPA: DUF177 domain-containing protein [Terriglobales bacterium]|nr:DUF177 domain-containing protein [Terriglobales bacterium]
MIIRVSELPDDGLSIDETAFPSSPYADPTWRLDDLDLHLSRDGDELDVRGTIHASVPQLCGRCAESLTSRVTADVDVRFAPKPARADDAELGRDDLDTDFYADDQLDLAAVVETETTVALPMKPLCDPGCRGLCPVCGTNRNVNPCACVERAPDPRLSVLKTLADRMQK